MAANADPISKGVSLNFRAAGSGPQRLVLLHGFGSSLLTWTDIEPYLTETATLFELDLKGHGRSPKPKDHTYSLQDQAALAASFILANGLREAVLVGHSYGGAVALLTFLRLRSLGELQRIRTLVLISSAAYPQELPFFIRILRNPLLNRVGLVPARWLAAYTLKRIFYDRSKVDAERIGRYASQLELSGAHRALVECARQIMPAQVDQLVSELKTIKIPALIVWGDHDSVVPLSIGHRLNRDLENSKIRLIADCGHIPHEEHPQETSEVILQYLDGR